MSSVVRGFAQPATKNLVALANHWPKSEATVVAQLVAGSYTQVGSLYMVDTVQNFALFLSNLSSVGGSQSPEVFQYESLLDMGKELHFGVVGLDSNLLTMRLVKAARLENDETRSHVGYTVTRNNVTADIYDLANAGPLSTSNAINVRVARV